MKGTMTKFIETLKALNIGESAKTIANEKVAKAVKAHESASEAFLDNIVVLHDAYACDPNAPEDKIMILFVSCASISKDSDPNNFLSLTLPLSVGGSGGGRMQT